jgi:negative regulator of sigma E activity
MNSHKHIQEELRELNSTLANHVKKPVFSVPNNYFENFAASVLAKLEHEAAPSAADELASLSPILAGLSKKMPFKVPENYFSTLTNDVPAIIADDSLPAILAEHTKVIPYEVPAGYFDTLSTQVLAKVAPRQAKVVSFNRTRWIRVAAAAVITGLVAISGLMYLNNNNQTENSSNGSGTWVAKSLQNVSNQDLEQFIENADINTGKEMAQSSKSEVRAMMRDVSVKEMDAFLSEVPADDELLIIN